MPMKDRRINFKVSEDEFRQINGNARRFGLATGTYLRLLGLAGGAPYQGTPIQVEETKKPSSNFFHHYDVTGSEIEHISPKIQEERKQRLRREKGV